MSRKRKKKERKTTAVKYKPAMAKNTESKIAHQYQGNLTTTTKFVLGLHDISIVNCYYYYHYYYYYYDYLLQLLLLCCIVINISTCSYVNYILSLNWMASITLRVAALHSERRRGSLARCPSVLSR